MGWLKKFFVKLKLYFWRLFSMFHVLRVRFKPNKEVEQCDHALISPPDVEMFVVLKGGRQIGEYEGLYGTVEQATAACKKFQELEDLKKRLKNS
jgi:hypothetical protein